MHISSGHYLRKNPTVSIQKLRLVNWILERFEEQIVPTATADLTYLDLLALAKHNWGKETGGYAV